MEYEPIPPVERRLPLSEGELNFEEIMQLKALRDEEAEKMGLED